MKLKSKIVASVVLAAIMGGVSAANAAVSVTLNLVYIGSTTGTTTNTATKIAQNGSTGSGGLSVSAANFPSGSISTASAGLTQYTDKQLSSDAVQGISGLKNYFAVYVNYSDTNSNDRLYGVGFDVSYPKGVVPVTGNNVNDLSTNKFINWNLNDSNTGAATWDVAGDIGTNNGDLAAIEFFQTTAANAYGMNIGTADANANGDDVGYVSGKGTLLGIFALAFTGTGVTGTISVTPTDVRWYTGNSDGSTDSSMSAITSAGSITLVSVPEPASLGVLALGGLALLARRRK